MPFIKSLKPFETKYTRSIARSDKLGETMWLNPKDYEELSERVGGPYFTDVEPKKDGVQKEKPKTPLPKYKKKREAK